MHVLSRARVCAMIAPGLRVACHSGRSHRRAIRVFDVYIKNWNRFKNNTFEEKYGDQMLRNRAAEGICYAGAAQLADAAHL
jgi:hypothetical protein